jgi:hypothetical protein
MIGPSWCGTGAGFCDRVGSINNTGVADSWVNRGVCSLVRSAERTRGCRDGGCDRVDGARSVSA